MIILFIIMMLLFNLTFNICYLLDSTAEDYYDDFINRKWYARIYMYTFYWLAALIRTRLIKYIVRFVFSILIETVLFCTVVFFDYENGLAVWLVIIIFGCLCTASYQCTIWEAMIKHFKQRRKYYAKNSKNN